MICCPTAQGLLAPAGSQALWEAATAPEAASGRPRSPCSPARKQALCSRSCMGYRSFWEGKAAL